MLESVTRELPMPTYLPGDHVKVEFKDEQIGESEWSSTLVNFGKGEYVIKEDATFLRLTFHSYDKAKGDLEKVSLTDDTYLEQRKENTLLYLGDRFLNLDVLVTDFFKNYVKRNWQFVAGFVAILAFFVSLLMFLLMLTNRLQGPVVIYVPATGEARITSTESRLEEIDKILEKIAEQLQRLGEREKVVIEQPTQDGGQEKK